MSPKQTALTVVVIVYAIVLCLLLQGCTTPTGIRPRSVTLGYTGNDDTFSGRPVGSTAGVEVEFEFTYPDDDQEGHE